MKMSVSLFIILQLALTSMVNAQYQNEQVLEKSFEKTGFFFQPSYLNPYGSDDFGEVAVGLLDESLLNLQLNPSFVVVDSFEHQTMYVDFRNSRKSEDNTVVYSDYYSYPESNYLSYPVYYTQTHKTADPVFSGAWFFRPFQNHRQWTIGFTYQLISQDDPFYQVPQDIYRSNVGYDYNGEYIAEGTNLSVIDRYAGSDEMHQEGQFFNLYSGIKVSPTVNTGFRLSRVTFDNQGVLASQNVRDDSWYSNYSSYQSFLEERTQSYRHWDISGGLRWAVRKNMEIGLTGGFLKGRVEQNQKNDMNYLYTYGEEFEGTDWSRYFQWNNQDQNWIHDGRTLYGGIQFQFRTTPRNDLHVSYQIMHEAADITLDSQIADSSCNNYFYEDNWYQNHYQYVSSLSDFRTGSGGHSGWCHHLKIGTHMQISSGTDLFFGFQYRMEAAKTNTDETVTASRYNNNQWLETDVSDAYSFSVQEKKTLSWDFTAGRYSIYIPIVLKQRVSNAIGLIFGINRQLTNWEVTDQTLAWFEYRNVMTDGEQDNRADFGERYILPREKRSDTSTMILGGLTIYPSRQFQIRLMMVPRWEKRLGGTDFKEFQWWIHFSLRQ